MDLGQLLFDKAVLGDGGSDPVIESLSVTENGTYSAPEGVDGYSPVSVSVPEPNIQSLNVVSNGTYTAPEGVDGYSPVSVNVEAEQKIEYMPIGIYFIDYDASIIDFWRSKDVANKTALPQAPTRQGMVFDEWNWSLADIKDFVSRHPYSNMCIGAVWHPVSGKSEFDIELTETTGLTVTFNMTGNKNWGDGTTEDTSTSHTYSNYGKYTILCDGDLVSNTTIFTPSGSGNINKVCKEARFKQGIDLASTKIFYYSDIERISFPLQSGSGKTALGGTDWLIRCEKLCCMIIPSGFTQFSRFRYANSLKYWSFSNNSFWLTKSISTSDASSNIQIVTLPLKGLRYSSVSFFTYLNGSIIVYPKDITKVGIDASVTDTILDFTECEQVITKIDSSTWLYGNSKILVKKELEEQWKTATNWVGAADFIVGV